MDPKVTSANKAFNELTINLQFQYATNDSNISHERFNHYQRQGLTNPGMPALVDASIESVLLVWDSVMLIFDGLKSLIYLDLDYLSVRAFRVIRDGEAFVGHCLLAMGFYEEGFSFVEDAISHKCAYDMFLQHKSQNTNKENLTQQQPDLDGQKPAEEESEGDSDVQLGSGGKEEQKGPLQNEEPKTGLEHEDLENPDETLTEADKTLLESIQDYISYQDVLLSCYQSDNFHLALKAAETYSLEKDRDLDVCYGLISRYYATDKKFDHALSTIQRMSSEIHKDCSAIFLINSLIDDRLYKKAFEVTKELSAEMKDVWIFNIARDCRKNYEYSLALTILSNIQTIKGLAQDLILNIASQFFEDKTLGDIVESMLLVYRLDVNDPEVNDWCVGELEACFGRILLADKDATDFIDGENISINILLRYYFVSLIVNDLKKHATDPIDPVTVRVPISEIFNENLENYKSRLSVAFKEPSSSNFTQSLNELKMDFQAKYAEKCLFQKQSA